MSLRWRNTGELLCAAKCEAENDDTYIDDRLHYQLSIISRAIVPDPEEATNGLWHWLHHDLSNKGYDNSGWLEGKPRGEK